MDIQQTPEEKLKTVIYDIYTRFFYESAFERRQVYYGQIWEKIVLWCNNYLKINANKVGVEIFNVIKRLVKDNNKTAKNKSDFFNILKKSLKYAEYEYYRKYEQGSIKISRKIDSKLKKVKNFIIMKESQLGRKLTNDEQKQGISKWFKEQEYVDLLNLINVGSISYTSNDGNNEIDVLNREDSRSVNPVDEYINKTDMETVREAVKSLLDKKQARSRDCYRALFTLHCVENYKDFEELYPVLDRNILEICQKDSKKPKPNQYEIYQIYHPDAKKSSAEAMASTNLREFLNDIETCLKEKNK